MTDRFGIGGNLPPPFARAGALVGAANDWSKNVAAIRDKEQAERAQDFVTQLRTNKEKLEAALKDERAPHDQAIAEIRTRYRDPLELIGISYARLQALLSPWLSAERDRAEAEKRRQAQEAAALQDQAAAAEREARAAGTIESELAARRAREAAEEMATRADRPVERAKVRGEQSHRASSLREFWHGVVLDEGKALHHFRNDPAVKAAALAEVRKTVNRMARELQDFDKAPPGCRFEKEERAI